MKKQVTNILSITVILMLGIGLLSFNTVKENEMKEKKVKKIEFNYVTDITNVSADGLWAIVGEDFANAGKWATSIDHSTGSGNPEFSGATCSERSCDLNAKGFSAITEKLTQYDPAIKELTYIVNNGFPGFVTKLENHWSVESVRDSTSRLKMHLTMEMKPFVGALMGGMMKKNVN
ncbi:MAG: hypothetical protein ACI9UJ_002557, partial [bacterium]